MQKPTVLAQAGKDLFLSGFVQDATFPMHLEPRHPAVAPNLAIIPEEQPVEPRVIRPESQIILVLGAPVCADWSPGVWLHHRITACIQLYKQITDTIQREQTNARCFVVPTGGDSSNVGVLESEIIRNRIIAAGISPHQIIMGCVQVRRCGLQFSRRSIVVFRPTQLTMHCNYSRFYGACRFNGCI